MRRVDLLCLYASTHEVLDIPCQAALSCPGHGAGGACSSKPLPPVLQGALRTPLLAKNAPCHCVGTGWLIISLSAPCLHSGFLPAHPDVLAERRWLARLHQRRVCQRKAPAPAEHRWDLLRAAETPLGTNAQGRGRPCHPGLVSLRCPSPGSSSQ